MSLIYRKNWLVVVVEGSIYLWYPGMGYCGYDLTPPPPTIIFKKIVKNEFSNTKMIIVEEMLLVQISMLIIVYWDAQFM